MLTAERLRELLHYDPETGVFVWIVRTSNRVNIGRAAGSLKTNGYVGVAIDKRLYLAHRLAWLYVHSRWPEGQLDHIDGNRANNQVSNLRNATQSENNQNQRQARSNSSSKVLGAFPHQGRYFSQIKTDGVQRYLGVFDTPEEAHAAYVKAKRKLHARCTI